MDNFIHPSATVDSSVILGKNNYIGPYCYITGNTIIGNNNRFESHCVVGTPAEHRNYFTSSLGKISIGNNNIIREFSTIHSGTSSNTTVLKSNIIVLNHSHIAHDCIIEHKTNISANVTLAGHVYVMEGANIALGTVIHQFSIVGAYSMVGMNSTVTLKSKILPGKICVGSPSQPIKDNIVGLERHNVTTQRLKEFNQQYSLLNENH